MVAVAASTQCWWWFLCYFFIFILDGIMAVDYVSETKRPHYHPSSSTTHNSSNYEKMKTSAQLRDARKTYTFFKLLPVSLMLNILWIAPMGFYCDIDGWGWCPASVSLAGWNSCTAAAPNNVFAYQPTTGSCLPTAMTTAQYGTVYHPAGRFPYGGNGFQSTGLYSFCAMDQQWALPTTSRVVRGYPLKEDHYIDCDTESPTAVNVVSIPGCNGNLCRNAYPDPTWGLVVPNKENNQPLTFDTANQTRHLQSCPGNSDQPMPFTPNGYPVPLGQDGHPISPYGGYVSSEYVNRPGRPFAICPACLWFWMTRIAGTINAPYNPNTDPRMVATGLNRCVAGWNPQSPSTPPPAYSGPMPELCTFCPPRTEPYENTVNGNRNGFSNAMLSGMLYTKDAIITFFWFATIRTYILQLIWFFAYRIICKIHLGSFMA